MFYYFSYLKEKLKELTEEKNVALSNANKYKVRRKKIDEKVSMKTLINLGTSSIASIGDNKSRQSSIVWQRFNAETRSESRKTKERKENSIFVSVRTLLNQSYLAPMTQDVEQDIRSIAEALLENLKDKNVTINHQRKTNK